MTIPVFSVVVPVHNAAATLAATLESVRGQTETDFELVAIDDGSTDASLSILLDFAARDARIRIVSRSNKGVAATRNLGVELGHPFADNPQRRAGRGQRVAIDIERGDDLA